MSRWYGWLVAVIVVSSVTLLKGAESVEVGRKHWAFQKPAGASVPQTTKVYVTTPVDALVSARLERERLSFAREAERYVLIRRVFLDLIGLPPSPEEVQAFLNDGDPDAYERLLDRLLASPHFGERWGRHWLDGAGHTDVVGGDNDAGTIKLGENKWRYRDYVVRAFNEDRPLDVFLREQIAGDEMGDWRDKNNFDERTRELLIATGFLRTAADDTDENELNTLDIRHGVLQRTVEGLAGNLLGLTLQCAKCHDHKYEPITQRDYYRLIGLLQPAFNPDRWLQPKDRLVKDTAWGNLHAVYDTMPTTPTRLLERGDHLKPGEEVEPGFLSVLCRSEEEASLKVLRSSDKFSGRRLALARWLNDADSPAGGLLIRVHVNRVWMHLFGRGIVSSCENLGRTGTTPTHPELLEWLAKQFIENGRQLKPFLKLLMTSTVYRQSSVADGGKEVDPDNRLLWRQRLHRLEAEAVRDSLLSAGGNLYVGIGGASTPVEAKSDGTFVVKEQTPTTQKNRRSLYLLARRNYHPTVLGVFDQPLLTQPCPCRTTSAVVLQSLTMLNDRFVADQAERMADRTLAVADSNEGCVEIAFQIAVNRMPRPQEKEVCLEFLTRNIRRYEQQPLPRDRAVRTARVHLCHMLLNTNEFMYIP